MNINQQSIDDIDWGRVGRVGTRKCSPQGLKLRGFRIEFSRTCLERPEDQEAGDAFDLLETIADMEHATTRKAAFRRWSHAVSAAQVLIEAGCKGWSIDLDIIDETGDYMASLAWISVDGPDSISERSTLDMDSVATDAPKGWDCIEADDAPEVLCMSHSGNVATACALPLDHSGPCSFLPAYAPLIAYPEGHAPQIPEPLKTESQVLIPMDLLVKEATRAGCIWFERGAMEFFNTTLPEKAIAGPSGIFFVTGEKHGYAAPRRYSVRRFIVEPDLRVRVETSGNFQGFSDWPAAVQACRIRAGWL